jgi:EAL domain-containing protein (putative c-di-GMP-specific phosphodiesterase class I)
MVEFPLDRIKIDRALVDETVTGAKQRAIVRAIAALGQGLGISTLVEGVTTDEHLERIQRDGCSSVQGFLSSRAVPAEGLRLLVESQLSNLVCSPTPNEASV